MTKSLTLDRIDFNILTTLQTQGRITNAALADAVGLSASPCLQRVKRLETEGVIQGYGALIDMSRFGETLTVFTEFTLSDHRKQDFASFETTVANIPEVIECHLISGGYDYLLKFATKSLLDYQHTIESLLESCPIVAKYFSYVVIKSPIAGRPAPLNNI